MWPRRRRIRKPPGKRRPFIRHHPSKKSFRSLYKSAGSVVYGVRVSEGQTPAWHEQLYQAKAAELVLYGRALGLSHAEAEDVVQETFVALLERESPPQQPEHYAARAFRNRALNYKRSLWRRLTRELESARWFERDAAESPAEAMAMKCLADLPVPQREAVVLKLWHEFTFEEIGELVGVPANTAAGRYRYGLEKLRACMKGESYERDERIGEAVEVIETAPPVAGA
jgi:RNA polymerase sigma-70 factor, ECF subfamily